MHEKTINWQFWTRCTHFNSKLNPVLFLRPNYEKIIVREENSPPTLGRKARLLKEQLDLHFFNLFLNVGFWRVLMTFWGKRLKITKTRIRFLKVSALSPIHIPCGELTCVIKWLEPVMEAMTSILQFITKVRPSERQSYHQRCWHSRKQNEKLKPNGKIKTRQF